MIVTVVWSVAASIQALQQTEDQQANLEMCAFKPQNVFATVQQERNVTGVLINELVSQNVLVKL